MEFKHIATAMTLILIFLLVISKRYILKFKSLSQLEANYFEAVKNFNNSKNDEDKIKVLNAGTDYFKALGIDGELIKDKIEDDLKL